MATHRLERLQEEARHVISSLLIFEVTDPLIKGITITRVMMTKDLGLARFYYESPVPKGDRPKVQAALNRARSYFRKQLAPRLNLRITPEVEFFYDETSDEISRVEDLFSKL